MGEIYQIDLSGSSSLLTEPDSHLINEVRGSDSVCSPIDLDLKVANDGFVEPLFVKSIAKLTPEQVAAIPKKDLPKPAGGRTDEGPYPYGRRGGSRRGRRRPS